MDMARGLPEESLRYWAGFLAKHWMHAVDLQVRRMRNHDGKSWAVDIDFLVVSLRRLRRAAELGARIESAPDRIREAMHAFD